MTVGIGVVLSLVLLVLAGAGFWLSSENGQRMIKAHINGAIPGTLSWEDLSLSLYAGRLELTSPRLQGPSGEELVALDRILINISWSALFRKHITAETLILETPRVWLATDPNGDLNIVKAFVDPNAPDSSPETDSGEFPFNICIDDLILTDGFFQYELETHSEASQHITIHDIDFTLANGDFNEQSARFSLRTGKGEMDMADIQTSLEAFRFDGHLHRGDLKGGAIALDSALATLNAAGNVDTIFTTPFFDLDVRLKGDLSELQRTVHIPTELSGAVVIHLMMRGVIDNPEATLTLNYGGGTIAKNPVDRLALTCHVNDKRLVLEELGIDTPLAQVAATGEANLTEAFSAGFTAGTRDLEAIAYQLRLTQSGTLLEQLVGPEMSVSGAVSSSLTLEGMGISPETLTAKARLSISGRGVAMEEILTPFDLTLNAQAELKNHQVVVQDLDLKSGETHLRGSGNYDLTSDTMGAVMTLAVPELSKLMVAPVAETLTGQAGLDVVVSGSVDHPEVDAKLSGNNLEALGMPLGTLRLHAGMDTTGLVTLTDVALQSKDALLQAEGTIQVFENGLSTTFPSDLALRFQNIHAADLLKAVGVTGHADGLLTVRGPLLSPEASLTLQGRSLAVDELKVGDVEARLRLNRGLLGIDEVRVQNGKSDLTLSGTTRLLDAGTGVPVESPEFNVKIGGEGLFLEDFVKGLSGKLVLNAHLQGDATHPRGKLSLAGQDIDLGVQKIHAITLASRIDKDRVTVKSLKVSLAPGEDMMAKGWVSLADHEYALQITSKKIALEHIDAIGIKNVVEGYLAFDLAGQGYLETPQLNGEVSITDLHLNNEPFPDGTLTLGLKDDLITLNGDLVANLEGSFNLSTRDFLAKVNLNQTRLAPFFNIIDRNDLTGSITGFIEAQGNTASLEKLRAVAEISELSVSQNDMALVSAGECHASLDDGTLLIPGIRLALFDQGHLTISGKGTQGGAMDFQAAGALPLEVIYLFTDDIGGIKGDINLSAHLKGTLKAPDFQADIALNDIGLTVPILEQKLHNVNGRIQVTPDALTIKTLTGNLDKGRIELTGGLILDHFLPVSVNTRLRVYALPIVLPDTLETLLNGQLSFMGTPKKSRIAGDILILEGRYYKDVRLGLIEGIGQRRREAAPVTRAGTTPLLKNTEVNIAIRHRTPFIVDNNMALMALKPSLRISGPLDNPIINGRAEVDSGIVSYLGKEFKIKKGVLDFLNPYKVEATIDVDSEVQIRRWTINLKVSGVTENLKFEMTSTPQESDTDIISLLVFNKTRGEMIKGEGGSNTSTKQVLADMVAKSLEGGLKGATGLDTIEMKYTERTDQEDADDVNITVGKELSKRITLKYGVGTKNGETVQSAITEYKFYENVLMNAFRDTDGDFGGELMFRLEMR
ncbi:hypothetical protein DSLASN_23120 [Desulfoluna limicola]|uniref:Translocation and assembly module TamB C-terminal domain-containing protein n=1 Tax=Desulfoluna limicola TaxID=2810562 RepID=A0ABN6F617_9BACT|nr:translocation/assembly module TamB domain-containing protein [Desulfoluna limicola]BCS96680.1 hypothetical protein DSLASN_23120 [Desulfoluna limicola]